MSDLSKIVITSAEIIDFLKKEMNLREVYQKILFNKIIWRVATEKGIIVTNEEIEAEANRQRREQRLEKATDTLAWLTDQLITPSDWEMGISDRLLAQKLSQALFSQEIEQLFMQKRLEFEQVILYQIIVDSEKLAQEIYYQIEDGEISFYDAAHIYNIHPSSRQKFGFAGIKYRFSLQIEIAALVFQTPPKQLIGPLKTEQGYHLLMVEEFLPAELTSTKYQELINSMFHNWLVTELDYLLNSQTGVIS
ncbi:peptidylprolyl isomerase [Nostoc sp. CCY0012]|uniref:peptidylprolyl isomerase n=1 Tax=Nostoc sp. CCY0012 TaxID=1056123 RepID=UPI0039C6C718